MSNVNKSVDRKVEMKAHAEALNKIVEDIPAMSRLPRIDIDWSNIQDFGRPFLALPADTQNQFLSQLVNRIGLTVVTSKLKNNDYSILKKGNVPYGSTVQEIYVNPAKGQKYCTEGDENKLLTVWKPDVKAAYHIMNRQMVFPVSISEEQLQSAFLSYDGYMMLFNQIINSMYSGNNIDEMNTTRAMIEGAYNANVVKIMYAGDIDVDPTDFVKAVRLLSLNFTMASSDYNGYLLSQTEDTEPVVTWTDREDQVLMINSKTAVAIDVDVLANAFNLDPVSLVNRRLIVPSWTDADLYGFIADAAFFQIYDILFKTKKFENGFCLYDSYMLHSWNTYRYSIFSNCVALKKGTYTGEVVNPTP